MFYNFRYPITLFLLSFVGMMLGLMLKILHWPGGQLVIGSMIMVQAISIIWLIIIIIKSGGKGEN
ncbi:hypothetical protein JN11_04911 [Mucilaginibacter frigoritolerans]|jgi:hypothetical protein|uniref:Uncharacterized protein n=1 Tax=Mucilaginibacter frigoritolerans TaxID=652788 RepID=A0A562TK52_9SPHI|nr:hypothetical protein [Mucilaginibacter frigoritolerans]TWI93901.1 hypothetical protein JN11_04911 [Mucilaginibacter frigoritolerans]